MSSSFQASPSFEVEMYNLLHIGHPNSMFVKAQLTLRAECIDSLPHFVVCDHSVASYFLRMLRLGKRSNGFV